MLLVHSILVVVQLLWHIALDFDNRLSISLRRVYLHESYDKPTVALIFDLTIPAMVAGFAFARVGQPLGMQVAIGFSVSIGIMLAALQFVYPHVVDYELWWLAPTLNARTIAVLGAAFFASVFCFIGQLIGRGRR